VLYGA
jgi:hypothetical protein